MFHLDPANNKVAISGSITATRKIGGMLLENNKLKSQYGDGRLLLTVTASGVYIDGVQQPTLELKLVTHIDLITQ